MTVSQAKKEAADRFKPGGDVLKQSGINEKQEE